MVEFARIWKSKPKVVISPVLVGGGKPYFPRLDHLVPLRLQETRTLQSGALYLRYQRA
jgi:dihydrofolate reductase